MVRATRNGKERAEHGCAKAGVANRTWPIQGIDRDDRDLEPEIKRVQNTHTRETDEDDAEAHR